MNRNATRIGITMNAGAAAVRDVADVILLRDSFANRPASSLKSARITNNLTHLAKRKPDCTEELDY